MEDKMKNALVSFLVGLVLMGCVSSPVVQNSTWSVVKSDWSEIILEGRYGPNAMNPYIDEARAYGFEIFGARKLSEDRLYVWDEETVEGAIAKDFEALMWKDIEKDSNQSSVLIWDAIVTQDGKTLTTLKILAVAPSPDYHYVTILVKNEVVEKEQ
jgi:hypothetical protein